MSEPHALYIDGNWVNTPETVANINPSDTDDVIGHYAQADATQVEDAITAANRAVQQWGQSPLETRYQVLTAIGNELIERSGELGELLAREEGKTRAEGVGEVYRSGQFFHYFAAEVHRQIDDRAESVRPGIEIETRREPVGVVVIIIQVVIVIEDVIIVQIIIDIDVVIYGRLRFGFGCRLRRRFLRQ